MCEFIDSEDLVYWYLRLNGFFTIKSFVVHPEKGPNQETEIDVLAIRLPHRAEGLIDELEDDPLLLSIRNSKKQSIIVIGEVKKSLCGINEKTWMKQEKKNMERIIKAVGAIKEDKVAEAAKILYSSGQYNNSDFIISIACFGKLTNKELEVNKPLIKQILWDHVLGFIYDRFHKYPVRKSSHKQWDETGHKLWDLCHIYNDKRIFIENVIPIII